MSTFQSVTTGMRRFASLRKRLFNIRLARHEPMMDARKAFREHPSGVKQHNPTDMCRFRRIQQITWFHPSRSIALQQWSMPRSIPCFHSPGRGVQTKNGNIQFDEAFPWFLKGMKQPCADTGTSPQISPCFLPVYWNVLRLQLMVFETINRWSRF